jgi:regulatory protein
VGAPIVTALRERADGRVAVALDGEVWRVLPVDAVVRAGLRAGSPLDRERARRLAQELRRARALQTAGKALRHRDLSAQALTRRLAKRGVGPGARAEALGTLERAGLVDDERFARGRAQALAERNYGDPAIRHDLESQGIAAGLIETACGDLPSERTRAERVLAKRGRSAKTLRYLAARGFDSGILEEFAPEEEPQLG